MSQNAHDGVARARELFSSARFARAWTTASVGVAVLSETLVRLIGWPGLIAMVALLALFGGASLLSRRGELDWQGILPVSLLIFLGWAAASLAWSEYQWASLGGLAYLFAFTLIGVSIALTRDTIQIVRAFGDVLRVILGLSLGIELLSGLLIDTPLPFLGVEGNLAELGPLQGIMGSRNQFGAIAILAAITFATEMRTRSVTRQVGTWSLIGAALAIVFSRSPVTIGVLLVVAAATLALYLLRRVPAERRTFWQLTLLGVVLVVALVGWSLRTPIITLLSANSELTYRLSIWRQVGDFLPRNQLEGFGWVGYWRPEIQPFPAFAVAGEREPTSALNAFIDVWFQLGIVGLFSFLVLVVLAFARSWLLAGQRRSVVFAWPALVLVALLTTSLAESSMLVEYGWMTFVVCCVKAADELSWRRAFNRGLLPPEQRMPPA